MNDKKNGKKAVWMYAVILFTSAFVVLLLTAYSQIKFSKNIKDYEDKINAEENAKNSFQINLKDAVEENKKLKEELNTVKNDFQKINSRLETDKKITDAQQKKYDQIIASYETLLEAENEYLTGNITGCAVILYEKLENGITGNVASQKYRYLVDSSFKKASEQFYMEGYNDYLNKNYTDSVQKLKMSLNLATNEYFSDDCYFFIAYSQYRLGDKNEAKKTVQELEQKYADSNYLKDAKELLNLLH